MNMFKRESDAQRAASAKQHGVQVADLPGYGAEIPFGNTVINQSSTGSPLGKLTQEAVLALVAGVAGFGLSNLNTPKPVDTPPPVDAVIEWEIVPDGAFTRGSSSIISESEHGVHSEESGRLGEQAIK